MLTKVPIETTNAGGGMDTGLHPLSLSENQFARLVNLYVYGDSVYSRRGSTVISNTPLNNSVSLGLYRNTSTKEFKLISIGTTLQALKIVRHSTEAPTTITFRYGTAYSPTTDKRPFVYQVGARYFIVDPAGGPLRRGTDVFYEDAGIPAPTTGIVVAVNATGVMTAATYKVAITYFNPSNLDESDYIESGSVTLAANNSIDVTNIPISPTPQGSQKRIWVTPPDQTNRYLLVDTIDNSVTSYRINKTVAELGEILSDTNGVPPSSVKAGCIFDNSHFVTDGQILYKSKYFQYETFDIDNDSQPIGVDDGHDCIVLYPWEDRLVAGKTNSVTSFIPSGSGDYIPHLISGKKGVRSPHAMKATDKILIWFDGTLFLRSDVGSQPVDISDLRIKLYLDNIPEGSRDSLVAEIYPNIDSYIVIVPQTDGSQVTLAYNYKNKAWSVLSFSTFPSFIIEGYDQTEDRHIYAIQDDYHIAELFDDDASTDAGENINYQFITKGTSASPQTTLQTFLNSFGLLCTSIPITATLSVHENGDIVNSVMSVDAYLWDAYDEWKMFELHTVEKSSGASYVQVKFNYTGQALPKNFKITRLKFDLLSGPAQKQQFNGVGV